MSWYDPGKFWSGDKVELVEPFELGGKVAVESGLEAGAGGELSAFEMTVDQLQVPDAST